MLWFICFRPVMAQIHAPSTPAYMDKICIFSCLAFRALKPYIAGVNTHS